MGSWRTTPSHKREDDKRGGDVSTLHKRRKRFGQQPEKKVKKKLSGVALQECRKMEMFENFQGGRRTWGGHAKRKPDREKKKGGGRLKGLQRKTEVTKRWRQVIARRFCEQKVITSKGVDENTT